MSPRRAAQAETLDAPELLDMTRKKTQPSTRSTYSDTSALFAAEAAYAESIFRSSLGDTSASIAALEQALRFGREYAPAILSMGSVEYQRGRRGYGRRLFLSLLSLPKETTDLCQIIDEAGSFLIGIENWTDGLDLFRGAAREFPNVAAFHQGIGCCAGKKGLLDEAFAASQRAIELEPENAACLCDLGWTLLLAERYEEADATFCRAIALDPANERAQANLDYCREKMAKRTRHKKGV